MSSIDVVLTVGKLDASLALLTTQDHHVIEFPTMLLPENVKAGSIIKMGVSQDSDEELKQRDEFQSLQDQILEKYGLEKPIAPVLKVVNVTQTSCVLAWDKLSLGSAKLKALTLYRHEERSMVVPNAFKITQTKISGLSVDTDYEFQLKLSTTSGQFWSNKIKIHTHKMTDMSGITVCLGPLDPLQHITKEQISECLKEIHARDLQTKVGIDTTHFVCNELDDNGEEDEELQKAKNNNIPIVKPEWIRACCVEKRIVGVRAFYVGAESTVSDDYKFPPLKNLPHPTQEQESPVEPVHEEVGSVPQETGTNEYESVPADNEDTPQPSAMNELNNDSESTFGKSVEPEVQESNIVEEQPPALGEEPEVQEPTTTETQEPALEKEPEVQGTQAEDVLPKEEELATEPTKLA